MLGSQRVWDRRWLGVLRCPLCPRGLAGPAEPVQECGAGRLRLRDRRSLLRGHRGQFVPSAVGRGEPTGQRIQQPREDAMELPWVLLALAGTAAADLARLPYVPQVPPMALLGRVTATTFALERPRCVFDGHADASDAVWLAVAFANASAAFRNPQCRAEVPPYKELLAARSYMTLETAAAAFSCSAPGPAVLRVGADTACRDQGRQDPCNGPLPSPGPYRVKFLLMGCRGPKAETRWSEPILLRTALSPSTIEAAPARPGSALVVIASILASLGAALAAAVLGALGATVWGSLCHRGLGTGASTHRSYRTHHIPPGLGPSAPQPAPCQRTLELFGLDGTVKEPPRSNPPATGRDSFH
ncbi:uroplakin-3b [Zonotrichia albicollis]|uniref:uroplakin-3b n=1 Tax=Zonotrichia albicollis TaxID=44394 RepID=UPI003D810A1D